MSASPVAVSTPSTSPIPRPLFKQLSQVIRQLDANQLSWASGYLAGLGSQPAAVIEAATPVTVLYASHTGNGSQLAQSLAERLGADGLSVNVRSAAEYKARDIARESLLFLIVSTHGEGEPPESAVELYRYLHGQRAPDLAKLQYAVFALGDSSYQHFCKAGRDFDERLQALGAQPLFERVDADVAFRQQADEWIDRAYHEARKQQPVAHDNVVPLIYPASSAAIISVLASRDRPALARVLESRRICTHDAVNDVHHVELEIQPESIRYQPGDSLGLWPHNDPQLIDRVIVELSLDPAFEVTIDGDSLTLRDALIERLELTRLHPSVIKKWAQLVQSCDLNALVAQRERLNALAQSHQFIDLVHIYPASLDSAQLAAALTDILQPIQPRLYSIASSQGVSDNEVHLTVSALRYEHQGEPRLGAASSHLVDRLQEGQQLSVYVAQNESFHLPDDPQTPIIMIGAGTGIAPYRAFLQQREAESHAGKNWLIFGNRHFHRDFLYQSEWLRLRREGLLDRIDLAFSRDSHNAAYVQDRLVEQAEALYRWIEQGAVIYVCGGSHIDRAVQASLLDIIEQQGRLSREGAEQFFDELRNEKRYRRDVY
jgi:sulfite reductase (NADPH) flavoprotein alpha-component